MFKKEDKYTALVDVYSTFVDTTYQRQCHRSVSKIAKNWDWRKVGLPKLSKRGDGRYAIIDGQHRLEAFRLYLTANAANYKEGDELIECEILTGLTVREEAMLFAFQDDNKVNVTSIEEYRAAVFNGDKRNPYVRLHDISEKYHIPVVQVDSTKTGIRCIRTLRDRIVTYGDAFFDYYCYILSKSGWVNYFDAFSQLFVKVILFLFNNAVDKQEVANYFIHNKPSEIIFQTQQRNGKSKVTPSEVSQYIYLGVK